MKETEVIFNFSKLRGLMRERNITQVELASILSISATSLSLKLNNKVMFSPKEILKVQKILKIPDKDFKIYFFSAKVRKVVKKQTA